MALRSAIAPHGDARYLSADDQADRWSATPGGGLDTRPADNLRFSFEGRVRGVGSETLIYGGGANLSVAF
jgi:hypothetical protein